MGLRYLSCIAHRAGARSLRVGDIIECMNLDDIAGRFLEVGKRYEVSDVGLYFISLKGVGISCSSKCFRKVEE